MDTCANKFACSAWVKSYKGKLTECTGCGHDMRGYRLMTNIADRHVNKLVQHVDHNTVERMKELLIEAAYGYKAEVEEHLPDNEITLPEALLAIQLRSLHIINDLQEAIRTYG